MSTMRVNFCPWLIGFALGAVASLADPGTARAESSASGAKSAPGPGRGAGSRSLGADASMGAEAASETRSRDVGSAARSDTPSAPPPTHKRGPAPRQPKPTLPEGVPPAQPDAQARRLVAAGPTSEERRAGKDDPELRALREAEQVLFPKPLPGVQPGWTWDVPRPRPGSAPDVASSGLPPSAKLDVDPERDAEDAEWLRSLTMPDLPLRMDARVVKYLKFYRDAARGRHIARVWAQKSGRYMPALKAEFARAGLPRDLVWLSLIESGHNPTIRSPAGAAGLWQFIPSSARMYGLTVDRWVDERLDPERATTAAIRFLSDLHQRFGGWELAMAAYNMGYGGLSQAIRKFNSNDFWDLCRYEAGIPWETTLYVPKIFAIAIVMNNKKAFGIEDVAPDPAVTFDTVLVEPGTALEDVARAAGLPASTVEELNAQYLAGRTPPHDPAAAPRKWPVRLPSGKGLATSERLANLGGDEDGLKPYRVRFGDSIEAIAKDFATTEYRLARINRIQRGERLAHGTVLLVPKRGDAADAASADTEDDVIIVPPRTFQYPARRRVFYRIQSGDTLGRIADAFGITRSELLAWNAIDDRARLQTGMILQVYVSSSTKLDDVRHATEKVGRVLVAGTEEFYEYFEGLKGKKRIYVTVKRGDTLYSIGRRHGMSVGWMERVNRRSRSDELVPGERLVVYTSPALAAATVDRGSGQTGEPDPLTPPVPPVPDALPPLPLDGKSAEANNL